jgi:hypothetical protein
MTPEGEKSKREPRARESWVTNQGSTWMSGRETKRHKEQDGIGGQVKQEISKTQRKQDFKSKE